MNMKKMYIIITLVLGYFLIIPNAYAVDSYNTEANQYILGAWTYNESSCIDGTQSTCVATTCYRSGSTCPTGTIIKYAVSDSQEKTFHVIKDDATNLTLIDHSTTAISTYNDNTSFVSTDGPNVANKKLNEIASAWTNVVESEYRKSITTVDSLDTHLSSVTDSKEKVKVRLLTGYEAVTLGCSTENSCPIWIGNTWLDDYVQQYLTSDTAVGLFAYRPMTITSRMFTVEPSNYSFQLLAVISVPKNQIMNSNKDDNSSITNSNGSTTANGSTTVSVGDTLKTAYIGYLVGFIILILGIMVLVQTFRKKNNINIIK